MHKTLQDVSNMLEGFFYAIFLLRFLSSQRNVLCTSIAEEVFWPIKTTRFMGGFDWYERKCFKPAFIRIPRHQPI